MNTKNILVTNNGKVMSLEISRPDKKNALTGAMYQQMADVLSTAQSDNQVSSVLIRGQVDLFTSGNDVKDFLNRDPSKEPEAIKFLKVISNFNKPIVAAVGGDAIGIGTTLLMHCDIVVAANSARFQLPFVNLGLCPEAASSYILPQLAGPRLASELLLLGDFFDTQKAIQAGIVNFSVSESELFSKAQSIAEKLGNKPTDALITTKNLLKKTSSSEVQRVMAEELNQFSRLLATEASKEIFSAFLEKRPVNLSKIHAN